MDDMMPDPYAPCFCESGKKFKWCHRDRERQPRFTIQEVLDREAAIARYATCLHPDAPTSCAPRIIGAHSVQRCGGGLQRIAVNGHVYGYKPHLMTIEKNSGALRPERIGLNKASTFAGFCQTHDAALFEALEQRPFIPTSEQAFLLGFRALARELYAKRVALAGIPLLREMDRSRTLQQQVEHQTLVGALRIGTELGLRDLETHKKRFDTIARSANFTDVHAYVITINQTPDILCTSAVYPECDFAGKRIQPLGTAAQLDLITFSLLATDTGGAAAFVWLGNNPAARQLVDSLHSIPPEDTPTALVRFMFEFFENIYISPTWWEGIQNALQEALLARALAGAQSWVERKPTALLDDGLRPVQWTVQRRDYL